MIEVKNIKKGFDELEAVQGINLHIKKGSIYGLLGSNGAGKTTLLKMIAGIYKQDSGEILISGEPIFENIQWKQRIIFLADSLFFFPNSTIKQAAQFYKSMYVNWNEERFQSLKDVFNIDINKKVHRLSKGMQRQVSFWLTLSTMPDILILDEPFDGLDAVMRQKVKNLLVQDVAEREMTILISSHNLREVEDLCDQVGILHHGQLRVEKDLDDLKSDVHKIQVAFKQEVPAVFLHGFDILYKEERGSVRLYIVRGKQDKVTSHIDTFHPVLFDILPLTLEEIFIYEMRDVGYAIENILV
jgi:ABC-2 type transport system ATP-binding protein